MTYKIHVLKERCKGCLICVELCQAEVLGVSTETNADGYAFPVVERSERCINCGACEMFCPDFAIWVTLEDEAVNV